MTSILDQFSDSDGNLVVPWYALVFDAIWVLMSTKMLFGELYEFIVYHKLSIRSYMYFWQIVDWLCIVFAFSTIFGFLHTLTLGGKLRKHLQADLAAGSDQFDLEKFHDDALSVARFVYTNH